MEDGTDGTDRSCEQDARLLIKRLQIIHNVHT